MLKQYVVDAFADKLFEGNPAAICVMQTWADDKLMQLIAMENNLSETAFTVKEGEHYKLRWFTPGGEIDLCGHATLATAFVLMNYVDKNMTKVHFQTLSGELIVTKTDDFYELDFPRFQLQQADITEQMTQVIGFKPVEAWLGRDLICVLEHEEQISKVKIDLENAKKLPGLLLHVSAKSSQYDCISRSFAPKLGVIEDPVCGSGHCHIAPLWSEKLKKSKLVARQASSRGGTLHCSVDKLRVKLAGKAILYSVAELQLPSF
ncbi:PhzF family phenazine biosynthesis protein [Orbus wheelerorum]|uniref:PhzF family phenazine biosynthesis protein n=1 Tax=Orbus wheelerorum TaxID=3074111 RepID=UPI00370DCCAA